MLQASPRSPGKIPRAQGLVRWVHTTRPSFSPIHGALLLRWARELRGRGFSSLEIHCALGWYLYPHSRIRELADFLRKNKLLPCLPRGEFLSSVQRPEAFLQPGSPEMFSPDQFQEALNLSRVHKALGEESPFQAFLSYAKGSYLGALGSLPRCQEQPDQLWYYLGQVLGFWDFKEYAKLPPGPALAQAQIISAPIGVFQLLLDKHIQRQEWQQLRNFSPRRLELIQDLYLLREKPQDFSFQLSLLEKYLDFLKLPLPLLLLEPPSPENFLREKSQKRVHQGFQYLLQLELENLGLGAEEAHQKAQEMGQERLSCLVKEKASLLRESRLCPGDLCIQELYPLAQEKNTLGRELAPRVIEDRTKASYRAALENSSSSPSGPGGDPDLDL